MGNILVINQYASTPKYSTGAGERFYYLMEYFSQSGYNTTVLSGGYSHLFTTLPPTSKLFNEDKYEFGEFIWVRLRKFNKNSFIGRFFSWIEFSVKLFFLKIKNPPKIVILSSMSIFPIVYCIYLKRKYNAKLIVEIRDIWPLTPIKLGGYSRRNPLIWLMSILEKISYHQADALVSVLPGFDDYIKEIGIKNKIVQWIPNAITDDFIKIQNKQRNNLLHNNDFNVMYAGTLGVANAMDFVVEAFNLIQDDNIKLCILGDGSEKNTLMNKAKNTNINFVSKIAKSEVSEYIQQSDVCIISWRNLDFYKYGVSANKYNDYMVCAKPILSASNIKSDMVILADCGICVEPENAEAIKDGIIFLKNLHRDELLQMGKRGNKYLTENQSFTVISKQYKNLFNLLEE